MSQSGYGIATRYAISALRKHSHRFDIYLTNTPWGATGWQWEDTEERQYIDSLIQKTMIYQSEHKENAVFDISLQSCIPNEFQQLAPINILYTAGIETTKISIPWFEGAMKYNKIIFTSNYSKYAFENTVYQATNSNTGQQINIKVETPMEVVNYPVRLFDPKEIELNLPNNFNFLCVAQWNPRKNIPNTIKYFIEEFKDKEVGLVLKLSSINNSRIDRQNTLMRLKEVLEPFKNRKCSIHLLHGDLSSEEMTYVYRHPKIKALISLNHGEGFGLPLFEAVYNGLPVITPAYGGPNDFIYMPDKHGKQKCMIANVSYDVGPIQKEAVWENMLIPESQWCFAKELQAKLKMKEMYKNYGSFKSQALKLQKYVLEEFENDKMCDKFANAVSEDLGEINIEDFLNDNVVKNDMLESVMEYA